MKKVLLLLIIAAVVAAGAWYFFRPNHKMWVKIYGPDNDQPLYQDFYVSCYFAGDANPSRARVYINDQVVKEFDSLTIHSLNKSSYKTGSIIGLPVKSAKPMTGAQDIWVELMVGRQGFASDTSRVWFLETARPPQPKSKEEIAEMRAFFKGPFNDFIIETYNAHVNGRWGNTERTDAYREAWENILAFGLPDEILQPIKIYIDRVQKYSDKTEHIEYEQLSLPIARLNAGLAHHGYPFYVYLYYRHFPIATEISSTVQIQLGVATHPVYHTSQVSLIAGGWTPPTLYGHAHSGLAAVSEDLHGRTAQEFVECYKGSDYFCEEMLGYYSDQLTAEERKKVFSAILEEFFTGNEDQISVKDSTLYKTCRRFTETATGIHEAAHRHEYLYGRRIPASMVETVRDMHVHPRNKLDVDDVLSAERRICGYLDRWSSEYNAYLTELIHTKNGHKYVLNFIYNRAHTIYESRSLFYNICEAAGLLSDRSWIFDRFSRHEAEWKAAYLELMVERSGEEIAAFAEMVWRGDFQDPRPMIKIQDPS